MAAQAAVAAVRKGCEMLSEGKAEIGKLKKTVEQGIGDAKAIYKEVTGLWSWLLGLFSGAQKPKVEIQTPLASTPELQVQAPVASKKKKREPVEELSYEEYQTQAIHQVCEQMKTFFEIRRNLRAYCAELEEISKTTATIEDSAIDRVEIELQLENMSVQIREAMVYAPRELRDIYSRFLKMYEQILEEQEFERAMRKKQERDEAARQWLRRDHRIELGVQIAATAILSVLLLGVLWNLRTQHIERSNFWGVSLSTPQSSSLLCCHSWLTSKRLG
jgi:hypothetical protein